MVQIVFSLDLLDQSFERIQMLYAEILEHVEKVPKTIPKRS